jgi:tetratricopeptide (TPR) repeat protein
MRSFVSPFAASAVVAITVFSSIAASAEPAAEPPVICAALTVAAPTELIASCTALIDNPAMPGTDRLDAMITRAVALHNGGQTGKALAEIEAVVAKDPTRARAFRARGEILRQSGKPEAAFAALNEAIRLEGDRARALQDYAEAVRLDPSDKTAADNHQEIALEVERLGTLTAQKNLPSFNCAIAKRPVEKAICVDPGLARLDRDINDVFLRAIASAEADSHRAALALTQAQRDFIEKRNASFGRHGYDLRQAMEQRLDKLNTSARP